MGEHAFCDGFITWAKENAECELRIAECKIRNRVIAGLAARSRAARLGLPFHGRPKSDCRAFIRGKILGLP
jgi:hypothetical protein